LVREIAAGVTAMSYASAARLAKVFSRLMALGNAIGQEKTPTPGVTKIADIPYIADGTPFHLLDVYCPEGTDRPLPVIVDIHGGGLFYGDKELNQYYGMYLASLGFTVVVPSYPLTPPALFEEQARDILAVYAWTAQHAEEYNMDMDNFYVTGDSAGAQLAVYTALIQTSPALQALYKTGPAPVAIRALGLVSGMFETNKGPLSRLEILYFGENYEQSEIYKNMNYTSLPGLEALPPCYLVTSAEDTVHKAVLEFAALLKERGVAHELHDWPKQKGRKLPHVFSVLFPHREESRQTSDEMTEFFMKYAHLARERV